ncbi:MAG: GAF domain-containing protein, partial [Bacteroidales bacterium]|nr:GAF domain-containing protein [Bacteroidales bacterium]
MKIWEKFKSSLYIKLMALFILIAMVPILLIGIFLNFNSKKTNEKQALEHLKAIGELKRDNIHDYFRERQQDMYFLAKKQIFIECINNLHKTCSANKTNLFTFINTPEYDKIVNITDRFLKDFKQQSGYDDIFLIDTAGNILYSVTHKADFATNIFTGPLKNSSLTKAVKNAKKSEKPAISDFELFAPSNNEPACFIANIIRSETGELTGFVAMQMSISQVDNLMNKKYGLGFTGESYLVGIDNLMRSNSRFEEETTILKKEIHTESVKFGLEGKQGAHIIQDYKDVSVLSYYAPVGLNKEFNSNFDWVIITEINTDEALAADRESSRKFFIFIIIIAFIVLILAFLISRSLAIPIKTITNNAKLVALGNLNQNITVKKNDEIGELANSFRDVQNELRKKVDHAKKIANGDYLVKLNPKSKNDELSVAINEMTESLHTVSEKNKKSMWVTGSQNDLNEKMRGDIDISTISQNIITCLAEQLDAQVGAIYLASETGNELQLTSSYALTKRKNYDNKIKIGEGIVGQAALEKKMISFSNIPDDYIHISSGLGNRKPKNIVVLPFLLEDKLIGVVELGSFKEFTDNELELLNILKENIAIGINLALIRLETNKLLEKTKEQAAELSNQQEELKKSNVELEEQTHALKESEMSLQTQQEELKQINEELEEQTKALQKSEDNLQTQQEELRVTNEELEEKTKSLEKQRDNINKKNEELKQAQIEIENKARDLELSSKYKSEFLANMSHELRTPLNSILVLSQLLSTKNNGNLTEKQIELASTINSSGKDLLELINDVLDLSKVESGMMEINIDSVNIEQFVNDMNLKFAHVTKDKGIEFNVNIDKQLPKIIKSDSLRLMQIIKNLLSNSIKYTHNGSVTVDISRPDKNIDLSDSGLDYKKAVSFAVTDTGIGITKEKQKLIFEAFKQADGTISRKYGGTGLGLSISKNFAFLLGGEIQLKSEKNKGSCFTLIIPEILEAGKE